MPNVGQQLLSGALSGFLSSAALQPLDLLKTRLQQVDERRSLTDSYFRRLRNAYTDVVRSDGILGLWRGTTPTLYRNVPGVALYFVAQSQLRAVMSTSPYFAVTVNADAVRREQGSVLHRLTTKGNLICGATSRVVVGFLLNPVTVIKARYESNLYSYPSFGSAMRSIAAEGPRGLLRGFVASSLRDAPYAGMFIVLYEGGKHKLYDIMPYSSGIYNTAIHSAAAAGAAMLATAATHPFDVLKTKIQVRPEQQYKSINQAILHVYQKDGALEFFNGLSLRLTRKVLSSVIAWAVFESLLLF